MQRKYNDVVTEWLSNDNLVVFFLPHFALGSHKQKKDHATFSTNNKEKTKINQSLLVCNYSYFEF